MNATELTIGRLARAADVNIETIRYYQRLDLLPTPSPKNGAFRTYPVELVRRIRFIKRAQELGFSLAEVSTLLQLEDGTRRKTVRGVATARRDEIRRKIADLRRMEHALSHLIHACETTDAAQPCPIIAALAGERIEASRQARVVSKNGKANHRHAKLAAA